MINKKLCSIEVGGFLLIDKICTSCYSGTRSHRRLIFRIMNSHRMYTLCTKYENNRKWCIFWVCDFTWNDPSIVLYFIEPTQINRFVNCSTLKFDSFSKFDLGIKDRLCSMSLLNGIKEKTILLYYMNIVWIIGMAFLGHLEIGKDVTKEILHWRLFQTR